MLSGNHKNLQNKRISFRPHYFTVHPFVIHFIQGHSPGFALLDLFLLISQSAGQSGVAPTDAATSRMCFHIATADAEIKATDRSPAGAPPKIDRDFI